MSRLRLAVVGAGHLGRIHARLASELDEIQLAAVVDPLASAREHVAAETGAKPLADYRELLGNVDAAVIATPTTNHSQVATDLLHGGLHLLIEKPITATLAEAEPLVALAKRQQLVLQVGHVERFNPALLTVRDKLEDPKYIEARRASGYTFRSTDVGVVLDLMIHDIDVVLSLVQSTLVHVEAMGISVLGDHEDLVNARLHFASGCIANLTASRVSYAAERTMQVFTGECCATLDFAARRTTLVEPTQEILDREFRLDNLSAEQKNHLREHLFTDLLAKRELPAIESNAIEQELLDFASAIRTGAKPQVTGADGRDAVAVAEQVLEQVAAHQWDGAAGSRCGAFVTPLAPSILSEPDYWAEDDTVILKRKAG
ncbi:MAG: Gfo/Idh/MocA family oxidoreductase [Planctomycetales bacterium]|nr:Gfo/Idh/MocA family oxidoreductase [Planctomycetales bacterium]